MKKFSIFCACTSILGFSAPAAFADDAAPSCSLATLQGTYAFAGTGTDYGVPYSTSGRETYDGKGNIKYFQLWDEAGVTYTFTGVGTYSMTSDCLAHASYGANSQWTYFTAPDGSVFYYNNNNNAGIFGAGEEHRISRALLF